MAITPESFQTYLNTRGAVSTTTPASDYLFILQGDFVRKIHLVDIFGKWNAVPFVPDDFSSVGGSWTVEDYDVETFVYMVQGNTMTISWAIMASSVAGAPTALLIRIPAGKVSNRLIYSTSIAYDNEVVKQTVTMVQPGGTVIAVVKNPSGSEAWTNSFNATSIFGQIVIEIQ